VSLPFALVFRRVDRYPFVEVVDGAVDGAGDVFSVFERHYDAVVGVVRYLLFRHMHLVRQLLLRHADFSQTLL
jgi:hypothetical protein